MSIRLAKAIAESGAASRRQAEELILSGRVMVDDAVINTPVFFVDESNVIRVDGEVIADRSQRVKLWRFYKPNGVLTTRSDPKGRKTVFDIINMPSERLLYIGRLDLNSEGLLLFTNNGALSRYFELPRNKIKRTYKVRVFGDLSERILSQIGRGVTVDGVHFGPVEVSIISSNKSNKWLYVSLNEGKNREIRRIFAAFGIQVNRLIRISYGDFSLGNLKPGQIEEVPYSKLKSVVECCMLSPK